MVRNLFALSLNNRKDIVFYKAIEFSDVVFFLSWPTYFPTDFFCGYFPMF